MLIEILLSVVPVLAVSGSEQQLTVEVEAGGEECYYQYLDHGETITVDYTVLDTSGEMARLDIDFRLMMPTGEPVIIKHRKEEGSHSFQGGKIRVGDYKICFSNKFSVLSSKLILFYVNVEKEGGDQEEEHEEASEEIYQQLQTIKERVVSAAGLQYKIWVWHGKDLSLADRNMRRVDNTSLVMVTLIILASILQAFMVKKLFDTKY